MNLILKMILKKCWQYIVMAILLFALFDSAADAEKYHQQAGALEETINDLNQEIKRTKIHMNDSIALFQAEVRSLSLTNDNLQKRYNKLLKASKTKPSEVNSVTEVKTVIHSTDTVYLVNDSLNKLKTELKDPFISINIEVFPDRKTIIDYKIRDSLTVINIQKRHSILWGLIHWKKHKGVRVINHNPKAQIVSLQTINVIE